MASDDSSPGAMVASLPPPASAAPASTSRPPFPWARPSRRLSTDLTPGEECGIVIGVVGAVLLLVVAGTCYWCYRSKRKHQQPHDPMRFYADTSEYTGETTENYGTSGAKPPPPKQQWRNQIDPSSSTNWRVAPAPPDMETTTSLHGSRRPAVMPPPPPVPVGVEKNAFSYEELAAATGGFSEANVLGQGGFGYVYKGVLAGEKQVAVKKLKAGSGQGEREFQAEVDMISRVHHRHLVSLVGYCISGAQRLLVYDYVPNQTLEHHLHGKASPTMDWAMRLRIAIGSARGIAYLHEDCNPRIIHRDIKSDNILVDNNFEALVADFGLAKLNHGNETHVSTRVMGTLGYLAPEYASSGKLTEKSDVFSYGVMLLELLTGRRPGDRSSYGDQDTLVDWARPALSAAMAEGNYDGLVDPRLHGEYDQTEAERVVACAAACVRHVARRRPKMSQIVKALRGDMPLEDLAEGGMLSTVSSVSSLTDYGQVGSSPSSSSSPYTAQMERTKKVAPPSPEYSGEYPGPIPGFRHPSPASSVGSAVELTNQPHLADRNL